MRRQSGQKKHGSNFEDNNNRATTITIFQRILECRGKNRADGFNARDPVNVER